MGAEYRLTPTMTSRKLQALAFIRSYIEEWGRSPSYGEIARAIGVDDTGPVKRIVSRLVREGEIHRRHGQHRSLTLPENHDRALAELVASGWKVNPGKRELTAPDAPNSHLSLIAVLDHFPEHPGENHDDDCSGDRAV